MKRFLNRKVGGSAIPGTGGNSTVVSLCYQKDLDYDVPLPGNFLFIGERCTAVYSDMVVKSWPILFCVKICEEIFI